jgi:hypothetical protein
MKFIHRITIDSTPEVRAELAAMSIIVGTGNPIASNTVTFEVDEYFDSWPEVERWIAKRQAVDFVTTEFSDQELAAARWLTLNPSWHQGYPQPDVGKFGYLEATYDLSAYCAQCGCGAKQDAPFQVRAEPNWGRKSILQLNWVFDEYFVKPDLWAQVFSPRAIGHRVVTTPKGTELQDVVQLVPTEEVDVNTEGLAGNTCRSCGRAKYLPVTRGEFAPLVSEPVGHMARTKQYFGSGISANRVVVVSQELATALRNQNARGASVWPIARPGGVREGPE